jgi:Uma2 family endonuclease
MYDLPSEDPREPGLPDEFHALQPQLLSQSLRLTDYARDRYFMGTDLNLYYASAHPRWHKRPDWFLVVDVPRLYEGEDLRNSFVVWDEGKTPAVVVELLSPGREQEDLWIYADEAVSAEQANLPPYTLEEDESDIAPPHKWEVYEQWLQVPYYLVFSRYTNQLRYFRLVEGRYQEMDLGKDNPRAWLPDLQVGLGLWYGEFEGITRHWVRWYDAAGNWLLTETEAIREKLLQAAEKLLATGMLLDQVAEMLGLSAEQVQALENRLERK